MVEKMPQTESRKAAQSGAADEGYLVLNGISRSYGGSDAVRNVNLSMRRGEFLTLLGPSGSGKSTTLMMIAGFVQPDQGSIVLDGKNITDLPPHKRDFGIVFQNYALFPHMTVQQNLEFGLRMRKADAATRARRVAEVLELVGLQDLRDRFPRQISGGQQQRVAVGRALIYEPRVLLMDEPLGALDRNMRQQMQYEIMALHEKLKATIIYVTHDQEEALHMSNRIAIMNLGEIAQIADPVSLYQKPLSRFVAGFLGDSNFIEGRLSGDAAATVFGTPGKDRFPVSASRSVAPDVSVASIRPERVRIVSAVGDAPLVLPPTVLNATYSGDSWRYIVALESGTRLMIKAPDGDGKAPGAGEKVLVGFDPTDMHFFTK